MKKHTIYYFDPTFSFGGMEAHMLETIKYFHRDLFNLVLIKSGEAKDGFYKEKLESYGVAFCDIPLSWNKAKRIKQGRKLVRSIEAIFSEYEKGSLGSILYIQSITPVTSAISYLIAKKYGIKSFMWHSHNVQIISRFSPTSLCMSASDRFLACSEAAGKARFGNRRFTIIKNGIDIEKYVFHAAERNDIRKELHVENKFVIGHVGRYSNQKNQEFLIDVFASIIKKEPNSALILVGEGEDRQKLQSKITKFHLEGKVILTGVRDDVSSILNAFDVFLFPSNYEGLCFAMIEAQANGLHCICSNKISQEAYITDLVEALPIDDGADAWAEHALKYKGGYKRKNMYQKIYEAGYDSRQSSAQIEQIFLELLKK